MARLRRLTVAAWAIFLTAMALGGCDISAAPPRGAAHGSDTVGAHDAVDCGALVCPAHASCDPLTKTCVCDAGYELLGGRCVQAAPTDVVGGLDPGADGGGPDSGAVDADARPADAGFGPDSDRDHVPREQDAGGEDEDRDTVGLPPCPVPQAPVLPIVHLGIHLPFTLDAPSVIEVGTAADPDALLPDTWAPTDTIVLDTLGTFRVFARAVSNGCRETLFSAVYEVREAYPPAAGLPGSTAVAMDAESIAGFATGVAEVNYGAEVDPEWRTPEKALGPPAGTSTDIVCLGRGGDITLTFDPPIADGPGDDFAVFENSFSDTFLELAFVEVSSDGIHFIRFDSVSLTAEPVGPYGSLDPTKTGGLAGTYRQGFGTPFDLASLRNRPEVHSGVVDLAAVTHVRIVDIVGDGNTLDSYGRPIWDPYPTTGAAGFDLDAIAVLDR